MFRVLIVMVVLKAWSCVGGVGEGWCGVFEGPGYSDAGNKRH